MSTCANDTPSGVIPVPEKFSSVEVTQAADINILRVNTLECVGATGLISQGVDCRRHRITDAGIAAPGATPIATFGDWVRDENVDFDVPPAVNFPQAVSDERHWSRVGRRVTLTVGMNGIVVTDPTRPARIYVGELPFRIGPFLQPPAGPGGDFGLVTGGGVLGARDPTTGAISDETITATVTSDFESRTMVTAAYRPDAAMGAAWDALSFGYTSASTETPGNGAMVIINVPGQAATTPIELTGNITLEYDADTLDIHGPSYVPSNDPGTGQPYTCPVATGGVASTQFPSAWEYIPLLP